MFETVVQVLRVADAVLAVACIALIVKTLDRWSVRSANNRFVWGGVLMLLLASLYTSLEQLYEQAEPGLRSIITLVALVYLLLGLINRVRVKSQVNHTAAAADD